jgi:uncharacterized protein YprB with RNaseH-like and TPR domain
MDLKRKLERLGSVGPGGRPVAKPSPVVSAPAAAGPDPAQAARLEALRQMLGSWAQRQGQVAARQGPSPAARGKGPLPTEPRVTAHGVVHVAERLFPPEHLHGSEPVAGALEVEAPLVASLALHPKLAEVDFRRMLFLDTETTGLAGGTGTVPFLVGLAWFEDRSLRLQQLFLHRLGEEAPLLRALAERMAEASCLVTFNGKSFDWPLLRTRFVLNRVASPPELPHLDLLHCARRVFKYRAAGTRLVHLEEQVLGHRRVGDVDGALIPDLYFRFLRGGDGAALTPVLEHNANDLLLLAALLGALVRRFRASGAEGEDPRELLGYAGVAMRARDFERAQAFAQAAARGGRGAVGAEALMLASHLARRGGDTVAAAAHLQQALAVAEADQAPSIHLALAKLYEHSLADPGRALRHARLATPAEPLPQQRHRVARLERKLAGQARAGTLDFGAAPPPLPSAPSSPR